jgi:tRNA nucleotidyltransferase (CCA-adding enzyme)
VVRDLARAVHDAGGRALIVGGFVRDELRAQLRAQSPEPTAESQEPLDIDLEVFGITENRLPSLLAQFGRVEAVGASFPVYKLRVADLSLADIDVALPRRESKSGRGHKGFEVRGDPSMSLEEAARRRDFTINAISWIPSRASTKIPSMVVAISPVASSASSIR